MKRLNLASLASAFALAALFPGISGATYFEPNLRVHSLIASDPAMWGTEVDILLLEGFSSAGACGLHSDSGLVAIILPSSPRPYATALAAKIAGHRVKVSIDDTRRNASGHCLLRWISVSES